MKPSASAPASTASRASSVLVIPQILTLTIVIARKVDDTSAETKELLGGGSDCRNKPRCWRVWLCCMLLCVKACGIAIVLCLVASLEARGAGTDGDRHFADKVKPLLDSRCVSCHGPDKVKGGLRLDSRDAAIKGGDAGPAVVPGKPAESLLLQAVMHAKKDLEMPPKERLTTNDIAVLERWIQDGAPWPKDQTLAILTSQAAPGERLGDAWHDPRNPIVKIFGGQRLDLWSLKPVKHIDPQPIRNRRWARNPIDQFILARLEAAGRSPAAEAYRRTLARRLYFDLTGLPPTPAQMERFLADQRSDAY